jgi:hypothetical protein
LVPSDGPADITQPATDAVQAANGSAETVVVATVDVVDVVDDSVAGATTVVTTDDAGVDGDVSLVCCCAPHAALTTNPAATINRHRCCPLRPRSVLARVLGRDASTSRGVETASPGALIMTSLHCAVRWFRFPTLVIPLIRSTHDVVGPARERMRTAEV